MFKLKLSKVLENCMVFSIRIYQVFLSPVFISSCRFYPSCSEYTIQSIRCHGPFRGLFMGLKRIARCNPWHPGGYDPVAQTKQTR